MVTGLISTILVNQERLQQSIETLAEIGQTPQGGVQRLAYSLEDLQARHLIQGWMKEAGMSVRIDAAGNIIGRYPGKFPEMPALATGSHIDTVPNGGRYDGAYGVLAALEIARVFQERQIQLNHPFEAIAFTDEEGSMIGSKAISGRLVNDPAYYVRPDGTNIESCLAKVGGNWDCIERARLTSKEIAAFVELHVEQGPVLESAGKQIGVVQGIVGQRRYKITVKGSPRHAGTTPMNMRQDALVAASQVVLAVNELANSSGEQVATVGAMQVSPNAANTIPGLVEMELDIRDLSSQRLDELILQLEENLVAIATNTHTEIQIHPRLRNEPALAKTEIQNTIAEICQDFNLTYLHLPSRASHDAQEIATFTDMGMIFVPSKGGVSHAETEYTSVEQCTQGANVLLHALLRLDRYYQS
ncbi:Zn-dependent hydrolase [Oscillatoria salina]|uniref:Zn-dependent hydrolase n=1 Tax=Oscillatoria salina TaxID=331517 RepID=UPI0013B5BA27|nr:Zn-dependent hydrolase [Oscillatoria salina]MBZ8182371.1 Zn-dependent hydrolase [Oscillatoria salina IIICB1]NET90160.1 Zn-dependent hydrolase [Kamptonema sp. SIO1D9]